MKLFFIMTADETVFKLSLDFVLVLVYNDTVLRNEYGIFFIGGSS